MSLNPSSPTKLGFEWMPTLERGIPVNEFQQGAARFTPNAGVTGDDVALAFTSVVGTPHLQVDIVPRASAVPGAVSTADYVPNGDDFQSGVLTHSGGGVSAPFYVDVDEVGSNDANYLLLSSNAGGARFQVDSAAFSGRPASVTVTVYVETVAGFTTGQIVPVIEVGGVVYPGDTTELSGLGQQEPSYTWWWNPATGGAWTQADIQALDGTDSVGFTYTSGLTNTIRFHRLRARVSYVAEARVAAGVVAAVEGLNVVSMLTPAGADTWSLVSGTEYLTVVSCPSGDGRATWLTMEAVVGVEGVAHPAGIGSNLVTLDTNRLPSVVDDDDTDAPAFAILTSSGPSTADVSQVYALLDEVAIYSGVTAEQEFTPPGAVSVGWVSFVCRLESDDTVEDLTVQVGRRDTSAILGTATITPASVRDQPRLLQVVAENLAAAASLPASQCFVRWSSTAESGDGWLILSLDVADTTVEKLTAQQQGLEDGTTTGWVADTDGAIANSATQARTGTKSLRLVWNTTFGGTATATTPTGVSGFTVAPGALYTASGYVKATTSSRATRIKIRWYTAAGALISTSTGADISAVSTGFTLATVSGSAPATAAFAAVLISSDCTSSTDYQYWDDFSVIGSTVGYHAAGYGNGTDLATIAGTDDPDIDIPVLVGQVPATIAGVAAAVHTP